MGSQPLRVASRECVLTNVRQLPKNDLPGKGPSLSAESREPRAKSQRTGYSATFLALGSLLLALCFFQGWYIIPLELPNPSVLWKRADIPCTMRRSCFGKREFIEMNAVKDPHISENDRQ